jgi:DNA polymerase-3 subunit alpha
MSWISLHAHSTFSLLDGLSQPKDIAKRCKEVGHSTWTLSDHGNLGGVPSVGKALKDEKIKLIRANEFYVPELHASDQTPINKKLSHLVVLAKHREGWKNLIRATSASNRPENFYVKPRLSLEQFSDFTNDSLIAISGHPGSQLANELFKDIPGSFNAKTIEEAQACLHDDWEKRGTRLIARYKAVFGAANFFVEIQLIDRVRLPVVHVLADCLRKLARKTNTRKVATADSHYPSRADAIDQRVLLCCSLRTTLREVYRKIDCDEDVALGGFFKSENYHIPSIDEMVVLHAGYEDELETTVEIGNSIEDYAITGPPQLPKFDCPGGMESEVYLRELCERGMSALVPSEKQTEYRERYLKEMEVINSFHLADYFLIVADIMNFVEKNGWLRGAARGSAAGCLVSYLVGITVVDPIKYDLYFERFLNAARGKKMPDIDLDVQASKREAVCAYIYEKYGREHTGQMVSFQTLKGRQALSSVLRVHEAAGFDEIKRITANIPHEAAIADKLQEMREETGESSIIRYALENHASDLMEWAFLTDDGRIEGPFAALFEQAIRLEGSKSATSKHPAGVIVGKDKLSEVSPMIRAKDADELIIGFEMNDAESIGLIKFDVLSLSALDKINGVMNLVSTGKF